MLDINTPDHTAYAPISQPGLSPLQDKLDANPAIGK
jgi:hypothetical protein